MKKNILLFLLLPVFASAQIVNIPDANFKAYLVGNNGINTNSDGEIQVTEAVLVDSIDVTFLGVSDLTGIEEFTALIYLICTFNSITNLDVSNNSLLTELYCGSNLLTSLDVSNNTALTDLFCGFNSISSLDVTNNTSLTFLNCTANAITELDLTNNTELEIFYGTSNSLTGLDVRNGNNVNMLLDVSGNSLTCISVDDAAWSSANWLQIDAGTNFSNDCSLGIIGNDLNQPSITSYYNTITIKGNGTATIFNLRGQRVHQSKLTGNTNISLSRGIYLVRVTSNGRSVTKKVYLN
ncbi:MAG: T9SS type A sorting domain-containing protein [Bacteroidetes bacterium]|nr:T9SS type A sorting domain-containing protein [Bacteroidota bacterium]